MTGNSGVKGSWVHLIRTSPTLVLNVFKFLTSILSQVFCSHCPPLCSFFDNEFSPVSKGMIFFTKDGGEGWANHNYMALTEGSLIARTQETRERTYRRYKVKVKRKILPIVSKETLLSLLILLLIF